MLTVDKIRSMSERERSVVATTRRGLASMLVVACVLLSGCGQKGALIAARPAPALAAASSPDTLAIPGVSPADLPAPVPTR